MKALCLLMLLASTQAGAGNTYPMLGGDASRQGRSLQPSSVQGALTLKWSKALSLSSGPIGHPIILEDRIVSSNRNSHACLDRASGALLWKRYEQVLAPPSYDPARQLLYSLDLANTFHAFSPLTGVDAWSAGFSPSAYVYNRQSVIVDAGHAYYGASGKYFICRDLDSHAELWRYQLPATQGVNTAALFSGKIYLAGRLGHVACLDAATGAPDWTAESGLPYASSVLATPDSILMMVASGAVECRRRDTGQLKWKFQTLSYSSANLSWCNGTVYVATDDRVMRALDEGSGKHIWARNCTGNFAEGGPLVICGNVYISGCAGEYYGFSGMDGSPIWTLAHGVSNSFGQFSTADGEVYVSDAANTVQCFVPAAPKSTALCVCVPNPTQIPTATPQPSPGPCGATPDSSLSFWVKAGQGMTVDADGGVSKWLDLSSHHRDVTATGSMRPKYLASGLSGRPALLFDGIDDGMRIANSEHMISLKHDFTVVIRSWTDPSGLPHQEILSNSGLPVSSIRFGRSFNTDFAFTECASVPLSQASSAADSSLLVLRSSFSGAQVFKDGVMIASLPAFSMTCPLYTDMSYCIGTMTTLSGWNFKGQLSEIQVYDRALDPAEIIALETCDLGSLPPPISLGTLTTTPTITPTRTFGPAAQSPTATPSSSPTPSPTPTLTPSPSATPSLSATLSATPTTTHTAAFTATPSATPTSTTVPTQAPSAEPSKAPTENPTTRPTEALGSCTNPLIGRVMISPNPSCAAADRMVSVKLGCGAEKVGIEIFGLSGAKLFSWADTGVHVSRGQWVHERYPHDADLPNGTYFAKVKVTFEGRVETATAKFVILK